MRQLETDWQAQWVWGNGEDSPRNEWRCFRKAFDVGAEGWGAAKLSITADSRYALYVNGTKVGRGPVRSWPFEQSYDTYEIGHLLHKGRPNVIGVMVLHFGVSNFYYLRGRGGLLVQVESEHEGHSIVELVTDESWKTSLHLGYDSRSGRMSCQQGFAERMDASAWRADWYLPDFNDSAWGQSSIVGAVGIEPWSKLVPRDIPFLTEELVWPVRIESLYQVKPVAWTASIDVRNQMVPESVNHANPVGFAGYMATVVRTEKAVKAVLGIVQPSTVKGCSVNGEWLDAERYTGILPERYAEIELKAGDNLILLETTGVDHGRTLQLGIDCDAHFEVISPLGEVGIDTSSFISIGPFASFECIDHQESIDSLYPYDAFGSSSAGVDRKNELDADAAFNTYVEIRSISSAKDLSRYTDWIRPFPLELVSRDSIFALSVWKKEALTQAVPYALQQAVIPSVNPAILPRYEGADTEFILDFGRELSGFIQFEVDAAEGTILDFYGYEYMRDGWRQDTFDLDNTLRYTCSEGRQSYTSYVRRGTFFWALASCEYYEHTGDEVFARDLWPHIRYTLKHYEQKLDDRGLLFIKGWNLLDWAPIDQPNNGVVTHQNMILVKTLRSAAQLAKAVGDVGEAAEYEGKALRLSQAINKHLWSEERNAYLDCIHANGRASTVFSMQTQVIAYLCGIAEGERAEQMKTYLFDPPTDFVQIGSPFMSFFYYEALAKMGRTGIDRMITDMRQHFGQMIEYDATTCWEMYPNFAENRANPDMLTRSHCHAWSAAPGYFLGAHVLGVTPADKGWRKVVVAPQPADLQWARGTVPLPQEGRIDVAWRLEEDGRVMRLQVWAPRSVDVEIRIPDGMDGIVERHEV